MEAYIFGLSVNYPCGIDIAIMRLDTIFSTVTFAIGIFANNAVGAQHGRFGQKARDSLNRRATSSSKTYENKTSDSFRFLDKKTSRTQLSFLTL